MSTILIIDDLPTNRTLLSTLLESGGYHLLASIDSDVEPQILIETVQAALETKQEPNISADSEDWHRVATRLLTDTLAQKVEELEAEIAERKRAEEALRESEERFSKAFYQSPIGIVLIDLTDFTIRDINNSLLEMTGFMREEVINQSSLLIKLQVDAEERAEIVQELQEHGLYQNKEMRLGLQSGEIRYVLNSGARVMIGGKPHNLALIQDITERKQAEEQLRFYASIVASASDAIIGKTPDGIIISWNPGAERLYGYKAEEVIGKPLTIIVPSDRSNEVTSILESIKKGQRIEHYETVRLAKDGRRIDVSLTVSPILDDKGQIIGASSIGRDISQHKQAEEKIAYQSRLLENVNDAVLATDTQFNITSWNRAAEEMYGYRAEEVLGHKSQDFIRSDFSDEQRAAAAQGLSKSGSYRTEVLQYRRDGHPFWVEGSTFAFKELNGQTFGYVSINRDITQRKQAEETLNQQRQTYQTLLNAVSDLGNGVAVANDKARLVFVNEGFCRIVGYTSEELLNIPSTLALIPPEDLGIIQTQFQPRVRGEPVPDYSDLTLIRKDGLRVNVELAVKSLSEEGLRFIIIAHDITERKQAEAKIAYQAYLLENVNDAVIGSDENSMIRFWNQGAERMFGWKSEEVLGRSSREILQSEFINTDRELVLKILAEQGHWKGEAIQYRKEGTQVIMEVSTLTLRDANGMITGYVSVNRDIAERKQAEEKIHKQNQRLKVLREIDTAILAADSVESIVGAALSHVRELIDCRRANLTLIDSVTNESVIFDVSTVNKTSIPKGRRFPLAQYQDIIQALSQDQLLVMNDLRALTDPRPAIQSLLQDGLQSLCSLPLSSQGNLIGMFSIYSEVRDFFDEEKISLGREVANQIAIAITQSHLLNTLRDLNTELEQRVVERTAALSQANSLLQMMLDHMPDHIYFKDSQSRFIRNSRSQASALGLSDPAEAIGKSDFDFFPHAQLSYEKEQEIIRSGKPLVDVEELVVWPDGRETWVSTTKMPLLDQSGQIIGTFGISRDITERKQAEVALQKATLELAAANKELEAFSYSVSHDLRSPLRSIDGFSQALLEDYADQLPVEGQNHLKRVRAATQRMAELIDDLLNLSKVTRASMKVVSVDLSQLAHRIATELQRTQPERRVNINIAPNLKAHGDSSLLQVVLENLLNNAWKYSSKREQAEIEFGSKHENDETIYFVRDNGAGFDMAYANKLFGAFQRLHAATEFPGTGIGLATVQRIIHRHGGRVWAESAVDRGARFFFTLPALERAKPEAEPKDVDSIIKRAREII
jgi:PAS domain S-box-containing protein